MLKPLLPHLCIEFRQLAKPKSITRATTRNLNGCGLNSVTANVPARVTSGVNLTCNPKYNSVIGKVEVPIVHTAPGAAVPVGWEAIGWRIHRNRNIETKAVINVCHSTLSESSYWVRLLRLVDAVN